MDQGALYYKQYLDGDEKAFDKIVDLYFRNLVFFLNRYLNDVCNAEDIAIDVFSDLVVHKNRFNYKVSLKTYLFMIGKSRAIDFLRHKRIIQTDDIENCLELSNTDEEELENNLISSDLKKTIHKAIKQLSQDMQAAIHLIYFEELSYKEASEVLGINTKKMDNLLYRAKIELKNILGREGESFL